jgi:hypothetical protein
VKALKWLAIGLAVLVVLGGATGYAILASVDVEEMRGLLQEEAKKATGRDLVVAGDIDLAISLTPAVEVNDVRFANAPWGSRPDMVALRTFALEVSLLPLLSGEFQVNSVVLEGADILLESNADGTGNWSLTPTEVEGGGEAAAGEGGAGTIPRVDAVTLKDSRVTYRDGVTGETMELAVTNAHIARRDGALAIEAEGSYQGQAFELSGAVGDIATLLAGGPFPVDLALAAAGADLTLAGSIGDPMGAPKPDLAITAKGASLGDIGALTGSPLPAIGPYDLKGRLGADGDRITFTGLAATVGGSDLAGEVAIDTGGDRPRLTAALTAKTINLADFGAGSEAGEGGATTGAEDSPYVIPDTPLPLDAMAGVDADATLAVESLVIDDKTRIDAIALTIGLAGGDLVVEPLGATFGGGRIAGALRLNGSAETPRLTLAATVEDLDYGALLKERGVTDKVKGTLDAAVDLEGAGASPRAIASTLDGTTSIEGNEGTIDNKLLAVLAVGLGDVMGPLFGGKDETPLNCVVSRFAIQKGVATSEALIVDAATFAVAGTGTVDLRDESLDMQFDTKSREAALVSLAIPFNVGGTLKNPTIAPDPAGAAMAAAKIAGTAVNPVAALGVLMGTGGGTTEGGNACVAVAEEAPKGGTALIPGTEAVQEVIEDVGGDVGETLEDVGGEAGEALEGVTEGVEQGLESLFGSD